MSEQNDMLSPLDERPHFVYRCFDGDTLLYVGCSSNVGQRLAAHRSQSARWFRRMTHYTVSEPVTGAHAKMDARRAEHHAIEIERPLFNEDASEVQRQQWRARLARRTRDLEAVNA